MCALRFNTTTLIVIIFGRKIKQIDKTKKEEKKKIKPVIGDYANFMSLNRTHTRTSLHRNMVRHPSKSTVIPTTQRIDYF